MKKNLVTGGKVFSPYNHNMINWVVYKRVITLIITILSGIFICLPFSAQDLRDELVVLDEAIENSEEIINALNDNLKVIVLKQSENQLKDLTDSLKNFKQLKALHLLFCGKEGLIMLNGVPINNQNISEISGELSQWKESFSENADLLIYTCNLANTDGGKLVIRRLSAYTGLDVAASVNITGNIGKESDWDLEFMRGPVETTSCFNFQKIKKFQGKFQRASNL